MPAACIAMTGPAQPGDWQALAARKRRLYDAARSVTDELLLADADGVTDPKVFEAIKDRRGDLDCAANRANFRAMEILEMEHKERRGQG